MSLILAVPPEYHEFHEKDSLAKVGFTHIERYLKTLPNIISVHDVQADPKYQEMDIDGIAMIKENGGSWERTFEVKVDTHYDSTPNYFFETISNSNTCSEGCFLKSKAQYFFYYFLKKEIHIFKLKEAQEWLKANGNNYNVAKAKNRYYYSEGLLVNRADFIRDNNVKIVDVRDGKLISGDDNAKKIA